MSADVVSITAGPTLGEAATAFLDRRDLAASSRRSYRQTMTRLRRDLSDTMPFARNPAARRGGPHRRMGGRGS